MREISDEERMVAEAESILRSVSPRPRVDIYSEGLSGSDYIGIFIGEYSAEIRYKLESGEDVTPAREFLSAWKEDLVDFNDQTGGKICSPEELEAIQRISFSDINSRIAPHVQNFLDPTVAEELQRRIREETEREADIKDDYSQKFITFHYSADNYQKEDVLFSFRNWKKKTKSALGKKRNDPRIAGHAEIVSSMRVRDVGEYIDRRMEEISGIKGMSPVKKIELNRKLESWQKVRDDISKAEVKEQTE